MGRSRHSRRRTASISCVIRKAKPARKNTDWLIVGLVNDPINDRRILAPREALLIANRSVDQGNDLFVKTSNTSPEQDVTIAVKLRSDFEAQGMDLQASDSDTLLL